MPALPRCWPLSLAAHVIVIVLLPLPGSGIASGAHGLTTGPTGPLWLIVKQTARLSVQELQCDVSVEEDSRQEWTFTLYDFDNNGKVTREVSVLPALLGGSPRAQGLDLA